MIKKAIILSFTIVASINVFGQLTIKKIKPSTTDATITTFDADSNFVYLNQSISPKNLLLVHLPGSYGEPKRATIFGSLAANQGFHSIGLMYPNVPTVGSFCTNNADLTCFENVRREIIEGVDHTSEISIPFNEGIHNRIKKLISYLSINYPNENWGQYLDGNGEVNWEKIIVSGHSQGGGHAAVMAKYFPLKRALCFSSPKDWNNTIDNVPPWLSSTNWLTNRSDVYVFNHMLDVHDQQVIIWDSLGLNSYGAPVSVDNSAFPYNSTRQLTTNYVVTSGDEHASTIQDNKTPKVNSIPVFEPVWIYMLTFDLLADLTTSEIENNQFFPSPTNLEINVPIAFLNQKIKLLDCTGKVVLESVSSKTIDVSNLPNGYYFLKIGDSQGQKIIKL
jgi:hypothetical protein